MHNYALYFTYFITYYYNKRKKEKKGRALTQSYDKSPYTSRNLCQKEKVTTQTMPQKISITQRLRTD